MLETVLPLMDKAFEKHLASIQLAKEKAALLKKTVDAYAKIIALKSERIFEAAFKIGEAYSHFAGIYTLQERNPKLKGVKKIIFERDINIAAISLFEECIEPHLANMNLLKNVNKDSLKPGQMQFVDLSHQAVHHTLQSLGGYYKKAAFVFIHSEVPAKIKKLPVQTYLYRQKMLETVLPLMDKAFEKHLASIQLAKEKDPASPGLGGPGAFRTRPSLRGPGQGNADQPENTRGAG
jgi:hypothetical protein